MKILHVCPLYYPVVGGVENVFKAVSERLALRGEDVTVYTTSGRSLRSFMSLREKPMPAGEEVINGVRVRRFPYRRVSRMIARTFARGWSVMQLPGSDSLKVWSALPWVPHLAAEIVAFKPDIVLAGHFLTGIVSEVCKAKKKSDFPLVFHTALHLDVGVKVPKGALDYLKMGDAVWATTTYEREYLLSKGVVPGRLLELGLGIDPEEFKNVNGKKIRHKFGIGDAPVVLFVGRKEREKGVETLTAAMEKVWNRLPDAKLILAGSSVRYSEGRALDRWIEKFKGSVVSLDMFKDEEKKDLYDACDIFVLPSRIESFGIVYLEAWISGKPVIGADIGSTRSIISEGVDGYLTPFGDKDALAERIVDLLDNPNLRKSMGERGREKVLSCYTWDGIVDRLLEVYRSLVLKPVPMHSQITECLL
jgi:glycosyltransferase involved in cell wall biosynthesis